MVRPFLEEEFVSLVKHRRDGTVLKVDDGVWRSLLA